MEQAHTFDALRAENFAATLLDTLNKSALSFMLSLGHRSGLFDTMSNMEYATSSTIAQQANLQERYVREWLGAMVTAGIVDYVAASKTYFLPPEHGAFLTRKAGANNMAVNMQQAAILGQVEDDILKCFREGGGVDYSHYPRLHEIMAEDSFQTIVASLESQILPLIPGLRQKLQEGIHMLDVGCGSGRVINKLATLFPSSFFTGIDFSSQAIANAQAEASDLGVSNVEFIVQNLSDFDQRAPMEHFDFTTSFDSIHDQGKPLNVLKGIHRALKKDGVYLMQDINGTSHLEEDTKHPLGPFLYTTSCMHCMSVSLAQDGEGLGAMWGEALTKEYLTRAGFSTIQTNQITHDLINNWYVVKK